MVALMGDLSAVCSAEMLVDLMVDVRVATKVVGSVDGLAAKWVELTARMWAVALASRMACVKAACLVDLERVLIDLIIVVLRIIQRRVCWTDLYRSTGGL